MAGHGCFNKDDRRNDPTAFFWWEEASNDPAGERQKSFDVQDR
jgi:hypothetical protein